MSDITTLLPPATAVRMVWALTGSFSDDPHSQHASQLVEKSLKDIKQIAQGKPDEESYIIQATGTMDAAQRSLDTAYKGRNLNFEENERLRSAYLESIKETVDFGKSAKDFMKSLPSMVIGAAGGVTLAKTLGWSDLTTWALGLGLASAGYVINLLCVRIARRQRQILYMKQDYERSLYYDHYIVRVSAILTSLYLDIDRIHKNVFGQAYPIDDLNEANIIDDILKGVRPKLCKHVHEHMQAGIITPELWPRCETGLQELIKTCNYQIKTENLGG